MAEISFEKCCFKHNLDFLNFETTADLNFEDKSAVLQKKAADSIKLGLSLERFGYNIYCSGNTESYKKHFLKELIPEIAKTREVPNDLCYVFNSKNKYEPILLSLSAGKGIELKNTIDAIIKNINIELSAFFKSTIYKKEVEKLLQNAEQKMLDLHNEYDEKIKKYGFVLVEDPETNSLYPAPMKKGKVLTQEEFDNLSDKERDKFIENKKKIDLILLVDLAEKEEEIAKGQEEEINKLDTVNAKNILREQFSKFSLDYAKEIDVINYKESIVQDILANIALFKVPETEDEDKVETVEIEGLEIKTTYKKKSELLKKYKVNLLVDNSKTQGAPVVYVDDCMDDTELFGCCKFHVSSTNISTDFSQIIAGELLRANGGYLIVDIDSLFYNEDTWEKLKTVLKTKKLRITSKYYNDVVVADTLKPEPIDIDIKVILLGNMDIYYYLKKIDQDFNELFRIHAIFEEDVKSNENILKSYIYDICYYINKEKLLPFSKDGLQEILRYSARHTESQNKLSLDLVKLHSMLDEADVYARQKNLSVVDSSCVTESYLENFERVNFLQDYYKETIEDEIYMFNVDGEEVGMVNGLSVSDYTDFSIGQPIRITCNTYKGEDGIISVDRTVELTGPIHDKSIEIIKGCVGSYLAQNYPLSLNISLSFEQMYGGLEGDSATCAEMVAIFSTLFNKPVKQYLSITGSMNQKGQVQAIGGVNEKIEGFYNVCKILGKNNKQGVVIPESNAKELMLSEEIINSIKNGDFHIYTVKTLEDVLNIMLGLSEEDFKNEICKFEETLKKENE